MDQKLLNELKRHHLTRQFDFDGSYPYTKMLPNQISGKNNSWGYSLVCQRLFEKQIDVVPWAKLGA